MKKAFEYPTQMKEQTCKCGKLYVAKYLLIVDQWRDTSSQRCPDCYDKWNKAYEAEKEREDKEKYLLDTNKYREDWRVSYSKIPLYYQSKRFTDINIRVKGNMNKVCPECMKYADNYPLDYKKYIRDNGKAYPSLLLASPGIWGCGKTHLVCAILHRILDRWDRETRSCPVLFITEPEIYSSIQDTYSYSNTEKYTNPSETDIISNLISVPLLVIDDVGKQKRSDMKFVQRTLFAIMNGRYDNMRPTILTTNMNLSQLENYMGANDNTGDFDRASFDRLLEMCKDHFWMLEGESQRGKI